MSNQNEIQQLAHELEVAEFGGDPGLQPSSPDWHQHPLLLAYERALDDDVLAEDLPLVPYKKAQREHDETRQQYRYQVQQWRQGYGGGLRRLADTGARSLRAMLILEKSQSHNWPEDPAELAALAEWWKKHDSAERYTIIDGQRVRRIYTKKWS
jgi:hypothetical protein